jgi:hypothetical protein
MNSVAFVDETCCLLRSAATPIFGKSGLQENQRGRKNEIPEAFGICHLSFASPAVAFFRNFVIERHRFSSPNPKDSLECGTNKEKADLCPV